ncbi:serine hydrolase domain-containing protein [Azohydromonas lata]|uniref:Serine hydrolase n=1 Tax=Azohydromonas lata TaxID=45677 RepID=A0ABU5IAG8_9BURK|nr:serine hydrolase [Azohydromonas lata]MDZ5456104.1 serine hydrolase [Azohydromonas lata]
MKPLFLQAALAFGLGLAATAPRAQTNPVDFPAAAPEAVGMDSAKLVDLSQWLRRDKLAVRSLLVVKDGKLVFERYGDQLQRGHNYELYSITKSVSSLLAGMLVRDGQLSLDDKAADVVGRWRPPLAAGFADKREVTLRHVLSMSSGLHYDFKPKDDPIYYGAPDRLALAAGTRQKEAPGRSFEYTDINPVIAAAMLSAGAGMPVEQYARRALFEPLGMVNAAWERADDTGLVSSGWGLRLRPMDMAKIGQLVLDQGRWQGRQLVPQAWIQQMTTPHAAPDFGYYWWVNHIVRGEPEVDAMGFKGQFIAVLPQRRTVVVMTSMLSIAGGLRDADNVKTFRSVVNDYVLPAIERGAQDGTDANALQRELDLARQAPTEPGTSADPTDTPRL